MRDELYMERARIEQQDDWRGMIERIPFIQFPADWQIQVIPPFAGAVVRFRVKLPDRREKSVYLDFFDRLGCCGQPYWEVYPVRGDTERCLLNEIPELLAAIAAPGDEPSPVNQTD